MQHSVYQAAYFHQIQSYSGKEQKCALSFKNPVLTKLVHKLQIVSKYQHMIRSWLSTYSNNILFYIDIAIAKFSYHYYNIPI